MTLEKFCTKCGKKFIATGREVICPACKAAAAEATKRAAVERAKHASWTGESVPVRISGRASTVIRRYGAEKGLPFAAALDELLKASTFFQSVGVAWEDVEPYKSRRRDKAAADKAAAEFLHKNTTEDVQEALQEVKTVKTAAKATSKAAKKAVKTTSRAATGKAGKKA